MEAATDILGGLMKAFAFLARPKPAPKQKFTYAPAGNAVHARRCLRPHERAAIDSLVGELSILDPKNPDHADTIKSKFEALSALPVKFVPIKRQTCIDRSKSYR
ncbi:hypothetical protein QA639_21010 [Bradyrhizobium pachyrhizi]|uniref:hypothetical protein n=1 Tax=Bradyrhizobium pachyrhizi TaxID=280333 RepID=UPI0024B1BD71|nr:hypothetical protein [Bradyrhizobium pachyrhizi]WFU52190.1 hypothetical protein QA639_21010 [Bradyrhizobium pachyrhizi]